MVLIGKTYGNLMVDVRTGSEKLRDRARRMVHIVTGLDYDAADALLKRAHWNVKAAIVMQKTGLPYQKALSRLRKVARPAARRHRRGHRAAPARPARRRRRPGLTADQRRTAAGAAPRPPPDRAARRRRACTCSHDAGTLVVSGPSVIAATAAAFGRPVASTRIAPRPQDRRHPHRERPRRHRVGVAAEARRRWRRGSSACSVRDVGRAPAAPARAR